MPERITPIVPLAFTGWQRQQEQQQKQPEEPTTPPEPKPWTAPASQEELDRIISDRLNRERAKFSDYDELKAAKQRLEELEAGQKTDLQKATERAEQAEQARQAAEKTALDREQELTKLRIAAEKGITGKELRLLVGATEDDLKQAADLIVELRRGTNRDPSQGTRGETPHESPGMAEARRRFGTPAGATK